MSNNAGLTVDEMESFWMPFTANRRFKQRPRLLSKAEGMYYETPEGRRILDGVAGLWCCNAGHGNRSIVQAIQRSAAALDYAPTFQMGHPQAYALADQLAALAPADLDHVFFTCSGSESVDTALKIALAYHRQRGEAGRTRLIGRERAYHGVGFGGISVGGIAANRKQFATLLPGCDHLRHTHDPTRNAFSRGLPEHGAELADDLERLVALHDASTIAAVIVEPVAGSTGVLPPPRGYLERLRAICDRHGILLIFDEVITAFGRLGGAFAAEVFGVVPDLITTAKGLTSGSVPMGAVLVRKGIYEAFMQGPEQTIELFHGYTYSAHPLAVAAGLAALDVYRDERLFERAAELAPYFEDAVHSLAGAPHVIDIRNCGLMAGIELEALPGQPAVRAMDVLQRCFEAGILIRATGETLALSPPLIISEREIDTLVGTVREVLQATT